MNLFQSFSFSALKRFLLALLCSVAFATRAQITIEAAGEPDNKPKESGIEVPEPEDSVKEDSELSAKVLSAFGDELFFLNGDQLKGRLKSITPDKTLIWRHEFAQNPIHFSMEQLDHSKLARRYAPSPYPSRVFLTNGDVFRGKILVLDEEQLQIDTRYAGKMTIKRPMLKAIQPNADVSNVVYEGPKDISNWTLNAHNQDTWKFKDGAFISGNSYTTIGKDVDLPDKASISFDYAWQSYPRLYLYFYTDQLQNTNGNCYNLRLENNYIYMQRVSPRSGTTNLGNNTNHQLLQNKKKARITLLVNKPKKEISLLINDSLAKTWQDNQEFAGKGEGLVFYSYQGARAKISNIVVREWDGELSEAPRKGREGKDMVSLTNKDKTSGSCNRIENGEIILGTEYGKLQIPLDRVYKLFMATKDQHRARREQGDIEAVFSTGGQITFALDKLENGKLSGKSENFGQIDLDINALKDIRYNIYTERPEEEEAW
jgi:hypothetical protein